jgi:hypothetical protein
MTKIIDDLSDEELQTIIECLKHGEALPEE